MQNITENLISKEVIQKFKNLLGEQTLPEGISIATMVITCKFDTKFYNINIGKYIDLKLDKIITVTYGDQKEYIRTLVAKKAKKEALTIVGRIILTNSLKY